MKPSKGRIVHFFRKGQTMPNADGEVAIITKVHSDTMVNLRVIPDDGSIERVTSVPLVGADEVHHNLMFCVWPPRVE